MRTNFFLNHRDVVHLTVFFYRSTINRPIFGNFLAQKIFNRALLLVYLIVGPRGIELANSG